MGKRRPISERFWGKVNRNGPVIRPELGNCWPWTAAVNGQGYGQFAISHGLGRHAHRVSWFLAWGEWPSLDVLHRCDNPPCVRPDHLFLGDDRINARDRKTKGRDGNHKGTANGRAKLDADKVRDIRARYARGERVADMPARFGVSLAAIRFVLTGRTWASV